MGAIQSIENTEFLNNITHPLTCDDNNIDNDIDVDDYIKVKDMLNDVNVNKIEAANLKPELIINFCKIYNTLPISKELELIGLNAQSAYIKTNKKILGIPINDIQNEITLIELYDRKYIERLQCCVNPIESEWIKFGLICIDTYKNNRDINLKSLHKKILKKILKINPV
jgi:hypothetical protein